LPNLPKIEEMLEKVHRELLEGQKSNNESDTPYMQMLFNSVLNKSIINGSKQEQLAEV